MDGGLACWILAETGLQHAAHDAFVYRARGERWVCGKAWIGLCGVLKARAANRFADGESAQLRRGEGLERALKLSYGRSDRRENDCLFHLDTCKSLRPDLSDAAGGAEVADFRFVEDAGTDEKADAFGVVEG